MTEFLEIQKNDEKIPIDKSIDAVKSTIAGLTGECADIILHEFIAGGRRCLAFGCDGMYDQLLVAKSIMNPLLNLRDCQLKDVSADEILEYVKTNVITQTDMKYVENLTDAMHEAMGGFFVVFFESAGKALAFSVQGFEQRGLDEPVSEIQERGAREGFTESYKTNITLIRRRIQSENLRLEMLRAGKTGNNRMCLCYLSDRVKDGLAQEVRERIENAEFDILLSTGYLQPFLDTKHLSLFSAVGVTERPDSFCAKLCEGKVGVLLDGTPFAIYVPHIFTENLHSFDDYANRPYYATFIRLLKLMSFIISILLPGLYVAIATFHQELFPGEMLFTILSSEAKTPFPIMLEALIIHLIFEVMREAGLRMPKTVGHAVSIVGALVIGEAAVTAGLIAAPMLIIVALTAISSFVTPQLYGAVAVLRLTFIIIGGSLGLYGLILVLILLVVNMTAISPYGVPYTSPAAPIVVPAFRDFILRSSWKKMSNKVQINRSLEEETLK